MSNYKYWYETISEVLEDLKIEVTKEQLHEIVEAVDGSHENFSLYSGHEAICSYSESKAERELKELKIKIAKQEEFDRASKYCEHCNGRGVVVDSYGRVFSCDF